MPNKSANPDAVKDSEIVGMELFIEEPETVLLALEAHISDLALKFDLTRFNEEFYNSTYHPLKQLVFVILLEYWVKHPEYVFSITPDQYEQTKTGFFVDFPESFVAILKDPSNNFFKRAQKFFPKQTKPSDTQFSLMIWAGLTTLVDTVPFIKSTDIIKVDIEDKLEEPEPIVEIDVQAQDVALKEKQAEKEIDHDFAIKTLLVESLRRNFTMNSTKNILIRISGQGSRDSIGISESNIGVILSGAWLPSCFLEGQQIKYSNSRREAVRVKIKGYGDRVFENVEFGRLIVSLIPIAFEGFKLPALEA